MTGTADDKSFERAGVISGMADEDDEWRFSVDEVGPDDPADEVAESATVDEGAAETPAVESDDADEEEWVTVVGEDDDGPTVGVATGDPDEGEGNVAGALEPEMPVEPGTPGLENVVFATAGAILTVLVFAAVFVRLDAVTVGALAGVVAGGAALLYVAFRRF